MKVVIVFDSFKESLSAIEACNCFEEGMKEVLPHLHILKVPMADGGEGTVHSLVHATEGKIIKEMVTGPLGEQVEAFYGILGDGKTAIIEMAAAAGLPLVPIEKRNPLHTTTYGVGELIKKALDQGCSEFYIGLGGSATNDGGTGMAQALGFQLLDKAGEEIGFGGGSLKELAYIHTSQKDPRLNDVTFTILCDVDNPLYGERGAAYVYGPQKGATSDMVTELDEGLRDFSEVIKRDIGKDIADIPGAGAAGGIGGGMIAFLGARLQPGIDAVIEKTRLREAISDADLVITGEGKVDHQTIYGKTPIGVAKVAKEFGIPVVAVAGSIGEHAEKVHEHGIDALFSIVNRPVSLAEAMNPENAQQFMTSFAKELARFMKIVKYK